MSSDVLKTIKESLDASGEWTFYDPHVGFINNFPIASNEKIEFNLATHSIGMQVLSEAMVVEDYMNTNKADVLCRLCLPSVTKKSNKLYDVAFVLIYSFKLPRELLTSVKYIVTYIVTFVTFCYLTYTNENKIHKNPYFLKNLVKNHFR